MHLREHMRKVRGVHGINNVNDLLMNQDMFGKWYVAPAASTLTAFGQVPAVPTPVGTAANADNAYGPKTRITTAATANTNSGWLSVFTGLNPAWKPNLQALVNPGVTGGITSVRYWIGLVSAEPRGSATPTAHIAAFRYDSTAEADDGKWRTVTSNNVAATHLVKNTKVPLLTGSPVLLGIESEGVIGTAPRAWHFSINGVRVATHRTTITTATTKLFGIVLGVTPLANSARSLDVHRVGVLTQA
jgi:hypothetical protein